MLIDINVRKLDQLIQALAFQTSVDVSADHSPELQEEWLSIAEDLIAQTGGHKNSPAMKKADNRVVYYDDQAIQEDPHLGKKIKKILRV